MGRLTPVMTVIMFFQMAFSQPMWEGHGTHLLVSIHSLRSPELLSPLFSDTVSVAVVGNTFERLML